MFSERSDESIEDLMYIDTEALRDTNMKQLSTTLSQIAPQYRSFQVIKFNNFLIGS